MFTEDHVRDALRVCFDPELAVNIVDLGLLYGVSVVPDGEAPGFEPRYDVLVTLKVSHCYERRGSECVRFRVILARGGEDGCLGNR